MGEPDREALVAAVTARGFVGLRGLVTRLVEVGVPTEELLGDLEAIRPRVADDAEAHVLDVMDLLVGWCGPEFRIGPPDR